MGQRHRHSKEYQLGKNAADSYPEACPDRISGLDTTAIFGRIVAELRHVEPVSIDPETLDQMGRNAHYNVTPSYLCATDPFASDAEPVYVAIDKKIVNVVAASVFREFHDVAQQQVRAITLATQPSGRPFPVENIPVPTDTNTTPAAPATYCGLPTQAAPPAASPGSQPPPPEPVPRLSLDLQLSTREITRLIRACSDALDNGSAKVDAGPIAISITRHPSATAP